MDMHSYVQLGSADVARRTRRDDPRPTHKPARTAAFDTRRSAYVIEIVMMLSALSGFMLIDLGRGWL